ncbi:MAG: Nif3-like dinuclear metal center hexameric protein [Clostridia bacterium]|nr:Nif3-like dinuclear metal center hexameric protein [Clostridia bacterium]
MPTVKDIYDYINSIAPFERQSEWDNSGIAAGSFDAEVETAVFALDITADVVSFARKNNAQLVVSHHPVIFKARKRLMSNDPAYMLANAGLSAICAHTSLDIAEGGVNDALTEKLGYGKCPALTDDGEAAMVRVYEFDEPREIGEVAALTAKALETAVRYSDCGKPVKKVAVCGGAGCDFASLCAESGCDLLITGDVSHHDFLDGITEGISIIAAGHYETENPVVEVLANAIKKEFGINALVAPSCAPCQTTVWI